MSAELTPFDEEIIALRWYPAHLNATQVIGLVGLADRQAGVFKVYIGVASGQDGRADALHIARHGAPILDEVMARHLAGPRWKKLAYGH